MEDVNLESKNSLYSDKEINAVGLGLRHKHFTDFMEDKPDVPWLEIHTENFFNLGSTASKYLAKIREDYPLSAHSVGLSLGSSSTACPIRKEHLKKIKDTIDFFEPKLVSDHLSWSASDKVHYIPDLLPVPYTEEALKIMVENINITQETLNREILIENPSSYLSYKEADYLEWDFLTELCKKTGCNILFDVNNIFVSSHNHDFKAEDYINNIPAKYVKEIHLAGYEVRKVEDQDVFIDTHGMPVYDPVWDLYIKAIEKYGTIPTLIEWDTNIPELSVLLEEKRKADDIITKINEKAA